MLPITRHLCGRLLVGMVLPLVGVLCSAAALAHSPLDDLKPGEWYEVPDSRLQSVAASDKQFPWLRGGIGGITLCWAGGAFDTQRDRLYIGPGGGHAGYNGNEVYAFDLNDLKWHRLNDPDPVIPGTEYTDLNKAPFAMHTYDGVEYLPPPVDRYVVIGGWGTPRTYAMDPDHPEHWEVYADHKTGRTGDLSAYDPILQRLYLSTPSNTGKLSEFDPFAHEWTRRLNDSPEPDYHQTCDIDWKHHLMVAVGAGRMTTWQLTDVPGPIHTTLVKTTEEVPNASSPGFCYVPSMNCFAAWVKGADVYTFDIESGKWAKHAPAATNRVIPGPPTQWGTFGRFRYVPSRNLFILYNTVDQNVFLYRLTAEVPNVIVGVDAAATAPAIDSDLPTLAISVHARYADGTQKDVTADASYFSLGPLVLRAALHAQGKVTGLSEGTDRVWVVYCDPMFNRGFASEVKLAVHDVAPQSSLVALKIPYPTLTIPAGDHFASQLSASYVHGENHFDRIVSEAAAWVSDRPDIATVHKGLIHALKAGGPVHITATLAGKSDAMEVTVTPTPVIHRICFQVKEESPRAGWMVESGQKYTDARGHGWLDTNGISTRDDRHTAANSMLMRFNKVERKQFHLKVPPGDYSVRIAMGDHDYLSVPFAEWTAFGADTLVYNEGAGNSIATKVVRAGGEGLIFTVNGSINYLIAAPVGVDLNKHGDDGIDPG